MCHADYPSSSYYFNKPVNKKSLVWNRERYNSAKKGFGGPITGANMFIFGHTPTEEVFYHENQVYIDTGAVFTDNLTLIKL